MTQIAPSALDILDFQFKLQCRLKVFEYKDTSTFNSTCNLLAVANRYGLLFIGSNNPLFQVIQLQSIQRYNLKDGDVNDYYRRNIFLPSNPHNFSVNCDSTKLGVVVKDDCMKAIIYDIPSFFNENITVIQEIRLSSTPEVNVLDTVWNPTVPSLYTVCKSDGSLGIYEVKETGIEIHELPKGTGATCMCWSPKGKQLAVGTQDGKITQYKPDLKIAKVINSPPLEESQFPIALQWISNYQFIAIYRAYNQDGTSSLIVINTSKGGEITYTNYDDVCFSYGAARPHQFYMIFQNTWNVLLVASSNSMEVGVLGFENNIWTQWILMDSARAELPLSTTKLETLPVGLAFDTSANQQLPWGETTLPPAPRLLLLSDHGVLCCFLTVNLKQGAASICTPPEILGNNASSIHFSRCSDHSETLPHKLGNLSSANQHRSHNTPQSTVTSFPFTFSQVKPTASTTNVFQASTQQWPSSQVQIQPRLNLKSIDKLTECGISSSEIFQTPSHEKSQTPVRQLETEAREVVDINADTEMLIAEMAIEECAVLESELKTLVKLNKKVKINLGTDDEATNLVQNASHLKRFLEEINEICQTQSTEIYLLKQTLIQDWAWYEEGRSGFATNKDCAVMTLVRVQPLDSASTRQLAEIRHLLHYLQSQLTQASSGLDEQWETFQNSCKKKLSLQLPYIEAIYQSMVKQSATVQKQGYILKDISNRIRRNTRTCCTPRLLVTLDNADKLEENLECLQLQSRDLLQLQYKVIFEKQKQFTDIKNKKLVHLLNTRRMNRVPVTKPQLSSKVSHFKGLLNTPLSPILPKKELQPQRTSFVQSTPKVVDEHRGSILSNGTHLKKLQSKLNVISDEDWTKKEFTLIQKNSLTIPNVPSPIAATPINNAGIVEIKTFSGSAFVPTAQNSLHTKGISTDDKMTSNTFTSKPLDASIYIITSPSSNNPISISSTSTSSPNVGTSDTDFLNTKSMNTTGTIAFAFGNSSYNVSTPIPLFSTVDSSPKVNFKCSNFSSTKVENNTSTNTKVTKSIIGNLTSPFNIVNASSMTESTGLSKTAIPLMTSSKILNETSAIPNTKIVSSDFNTSSVFNPNPFEIQLKNNSKISTSVPSCTTSTSTTSSLKVSTTVATVVESVKVLSNNSLQIALEPVLIPPFSAITPLSNKADLSMITPTLSSQSLSAIYTTSNANLTVSIVNKEKSMTTSFTTPTLATDSKKIIGSPECKRTTVSTTTVEPLTTTVSATVFSLSTTTVTCSNNTESMFGGLQITSSCIAQPVQQSTPFFGNTQPQLIGSPFGNSQQKSSAFTGLERSITVCTANSLFSEEPISTSVSILGIPQAPIPGSNTIATCTPATTTAVMFGGNNVTSSTIPSLFNTVTTSQPSIFSSVSSMPTPIFGIDTTTNTIIQSSAFGITTSSKLFDDARNVPNTSGCVFRGTSTPSSLGTPTTTSIDEFNSSSHFDIVNITANKFLIPPSTTTAFGQNIFGSTSIFSNTTSTHVGSIFGGSSANPTNVFGTTTSTSENTSFGVPFGCTAGENTSSGNRSFGFNSSPFTSFVNNSNSTNTFGNGYSQNPFTRTSNTEQKPPFSGGSLFGSASTTSTSNIFGGTSPFNITTPAFGGPATFGSSSIFGQQGSGFSRTMFGSSSNVFGNTTQIANFSGTNQAVTQSRFGTPPVFGSPSSFGSATPGAFGAPPAFGSSNFGTTSTFNSPNTFAPSGQQSPTFANFADQQTLGFGSLAQQSQPPTSQQTFSGGSSFSNWR